MRYSIVRDRKNCQVCKRSFSNGSALRGHMMSHTLKRSAPNAGSASGSTLPSLETSNKVGANFKPHETVLIRSNHTSKVGEPDRKRQEGGQEINGKRKTIAEEAVEEAGLVLVAMSKGQRPENSQNWNAIDRFLAAPNGKEEYHETDLDSDDDDDDDDNKDVKYKSVAELLAQNMETITEDSDEGVDSDADGETYLVAREKKCKKTFTCDICGKVLGSCQALGGHRASNKCKRLKVCDKNDQDRRYICGFCGRAFESGQALGGHTKCHFF